MAFVTCDKEFSWLYLNCAWRQYKSV